MSSPGEAQRLEALENLLEAVSRLADCAAEQNAYLHPCGWTRDEPFVHVTQHPPCMPMGELYDALDDVWIVWGSDLRPALTGEGRRALDVLFGRLRDFFSVPYVDEISTLESAEWDAVRQEARGTLLILSRDGTASTGAQ